MNEQEHEDVHELLKQSLVPVDTELRRDLWPLMLRRLAERPDTKPWFSVLFSSAALASVPWFDWALLALLVVGVSLFPRSIPIWLYNL